MPASVTVIGGGVIGVEFAYLLNRLGSKVTVLELMDHILPMVDIEVSRLAEKRMTKDGILFRLGAKVSRVKGDTVYYEYEGQECQVKSDMVFMAVGRVPNTQGLNAEGIGIEFDRKAIRTDAHMRTNIPPYLCHWGREREGYAGPHRLPRGYGGSGGHLRPRGGDAL